VTTTAVEAAEKSGGCAGQERSQAAVVCAAQHSGGERRLQADCALCLSYPAWKRHAVRYWAFFHFHQFTDSWTPMLGSVNSFLAHPGLAIYQAKLYDTLLYPLTSILPLLWMKQAGMSDRGGAARADGCVSWIAGGRGGCAAGADRREDRWAGKWRVELAGRGGDGVRGVLLHAHHAGLLAGPGADIFSTSSSPFWFSSGSSAGNGPRALMMALLTMVKPQFGLLLLWAALRRRWNALAAGVVALGWAARSRWRPSACATTWTIWACWPG